MKKNKILILFILMLVLVGCDTIAVNEIHNRTIKYEEITINDLNTLTTTIVSNARDSVVGVTNYKRVALVSYEISGTGSGVIYDCKAVMQNGSTISDCMSTSDRNDVKRYDYLVVTNRHVIEKSNKLKVYIGQDDAHIEAELIKADDKVDIAVLKFSYYRPIQPLIFADSDLVKPGNIAIAIGNPYGHEFWGSATFGIISSPKRYMEDDTDDNGKEDWINEYIQHDVAINPGNSGGALLDAQGKVIGINSLKFVGEDTDSMGFAIPSNVVVNLLSYLEKGQLPKRINLGLAYEPIKQLINPDDYYIKDRENYIVPNEISYGLYVYSVAFGNPYNAKFKKDDIILEINGKKIYYLYDEKNQLEFLNKGDIIKFLVYRNNEEIIINIII